MSVILTIHSLIRWLIVLLALAAIIKLALGWRQGRAFDKMASGLVSGYTGLLDLQLLIGQHDGGDRGGAPVRDLEEGRRPDPLSQHAAGDRAFAIDHLCRDHPHRRLGPLVAHQRTFLGGSKF